MCLGWLEARFLLLWNLHTDVAGPADSAVVGDDVGVKADEVQFGGRDVRLSGTVWVSDRPVPTPGVVLVGGSGPADRSNGGYFNALRDGLVAAGVTVLSFDKRGVGGSSGTWASAGVADLAADVVSAVQVLRAHPAVDRRVVGVFGHSEGGWVALRALALGAPARHLVLNSCPAVSFLEAEVYALAADGVDLDVARAWFQRQQDAVRADADLAEMVRVFVDEPDPVLRKVIERSEFRLTDDSYAQLRAWIDYAPDADLKRLRTPTLAIYGTHDPLTPVQASVDRLPRLAPTTRTELFVGADHRLCADGTLVPGYLDLVTEWCVSPPSGAELSIR